MHLPRARGPDHLDDLAAGGAAHDGVVDDHDALAVQDLAVRVELHLDPEVADALLRLDEGTAHVVVADEAHVVGQARLLRVAERRPDPGVGHRDDQVGDHRILAGELVAERLAHRVHVPAPQHRVRPREVDVLEHALQPLGGAEGLERGEAALVDDQDLARLDVAHHLGFHQVERAGLRGEHPRVVQAAQRERPEAGGIAHADDRASGSAGAGCRRPRTRVSARASCSASVAPSDAGEQVQDDLGVGRRLEDRAVLLELLPERLRVHEVAVVGDGDRPVHGGRR